MNHTPTPPLSPLPGQESPGARLAAAVGADQVEGTSLPVNPFLAFLSSEIRKYSVLIDVFGVDYFDRLAFKAYLDDLCRASSVYSRFLSTQPARGAVGTESVARPNGAPGRPLC